MNQIVWKTFGNRLIASMKPIAGNYQKNVDELISFDRKLKCEHPGIYNACQRKSVWLIRKTNYKIFPLGAWIYKIFRG